MERQRQHRRRRQLRLRDCCRNEVGVMTQPSKRKSEVSEGLPARVGLALAGWSERWFPDPMVIALVGVVVVFVLGVLSGVSPARMAIEGGKSFWALVPFTMQMIMVIVGGHVVASAPLVRGAIKRLARVPGS